MMATERPYPDPPFLVSDFCEHCAPKAGAILKWFDDLDDVFVERITSGVGECVRISEPTTTPADTLREAGISSRRQARYQRRMSRLLAGRQ